MSDRTIPPRRCIDLKAMFRTRFRIEHDPAYYSEYGDQGRTHDPWLIVIPCQHGHIYPHGGDLLGVATNRHGTTCKKLAAIPDLTVKQNGDDGINAFFDVSLFSKVAEIMRPKRKRQLTAEQRAANIERLAKYHFRPAAQSDSGAESRDPAAGVANDTKSSSNASGARNLRRRRA